MNTLDKLTIARFIISAIYVAMYIIIVVLAQKRDMTRNKYTILSSIAIVIYAVVNWVLLPMCFQ